jgi:uncharacterized protein
VEDVEKRRASHSAVLWGWGSDPVRGGGGLVIGTPGAPGASGGMHGGDPAAAGMAPFAVDDPDATLAQVAGRGGERVLSHEDSVRLGRFAICKDDQGSLFGLHEGEG